MTNGPKTKRAELAHRLRCAAADAGMTAPSLARKLNISQGAAYNYLSGKQVPSPLRLRQMQAVFGWDDSARLESFDLLAMAKGEK